MEIVYLHNENIMDYSGSDNSDNEADCGLDNEIEVSISYGSLIEEDKSKNEQILLPVCIFNNSSLSALEAISKFLKEEKGMRYCEISSILNRDSKTIWGAYNNAKRKMSERLNIENSCFQLPFYIFKDRTFGTLEVIVRHLKEELNLRYCQIASLLNRDDRTIWTVYNRVKRKISKLENGKSQ